MEIKSFLFLLLTISGFFLSACQSVRHREDQQAKSEPIIFSQNSQGIKTQSPESNEVLPVGIYFGPGAMRSFAFVGVLKALAQAQVPIVSVGGSEWGAVVAALYSFSKSANDVEWQMLKLRQDQLPLKSFIKKEVEPREDEALESFLSFVFTDKNLENAKIPFICPTTDGVQSVFLRSGKAWEQLMKCVAIPPFYKNYKGWVSGAINLSAGLSAGLNVGSGNWAEAMAKDGAKFIIYVDALGDEPLFSKSRFSNQENARLFWAAIKALSRDQYRQANMVLNVPISLDLLDFDNRREAIKVGEKFASGVMPDLLKIIGINQ